MRCLKLDVDLALERFCMSFVALFVRYFKSHPSSATRPLWDEALADYVTSNMSETVDTHATPPWQLLTQPPPMTLAEQLGFLGQLSNYHWRVHLLPGETRPGEARMMSRRLDSTYSAMLLYVPRCKREFRQDDSRKSPPKSMRLLLLYYLDSKHDHDQLYLRDVIRHWFKDPLVGLVPYVLFTTYTCTGTK